jgi:hypothetical protein
MCGRCNVKVAVRIEAARKPVDDHHSLIFRQRTAAGRTPEHLRARLDFIDVLPTWPTGPGKPPANLVFRDDK